MSTIALDCRAVGFEEAGGGDPVFVLEVATALRYEGEALRWPLRCTYAQVDRLHILCYQLEPELRAMGLRVPAAEIDGTGGGGGRARGCLSDALVSVGPSGRGGTGSFVSADGLIVTNHHVALDAVRQASAAAGRDYLAEGFCARERGAERVRFAPSAQRAPRARVLRDEHRPALDQRRRALLNLDGVLQRGN